MTLEAMIKAIQSIFFAAAFYGVEAATVTPKQCAHFTTAVIDAIKNRNDDHNIDQFFATATMYKEDLDPQVQIFSRRALQLRRSAVKKAGAEGRFKKLLK